MQKRKPVDERIPGLLKAAVLQVFRKISMRGVLKGAHG